MKRPLLGSALILVLLLSLGEGAFQPAVASGWSIGGGFRVGGLHFSLAYADGHRGRHGGHYYRTRGHVRYDGYRCGRSCFKRAAYNYHHSACPLVLHHFRRHDYHPTRFHGSYYGPPPVYGYGVGGYYSPRGRGYSYRSNHPDYGHRDHYGYPGRGHHRHHGRSSCSDR